eukprot:PITA_03310
MACVELVNFSVIINGIPSPFFAASRGLRQGCPLSPLLFILAMNTLSLHINKAVEEARVRPLKLCRGISISHNLFVDDIIIFGMLCKLSWSCYFDILAKFQRATGLNINLEKPGFFHNDSDLVLITWLSEKFGIKAHPIGRGLKYLGFQLKAMGYKKTDWGWILDKFHKRISGWQFRFLSLGGSQFYLGSPGWKKKYHLSSLPNISKPKNLGRWGFLDLKSFGKDLLCNSLWKGVFGKGPWSNIIRVKYLRRRSLAYWLRRKQLASPGGSLVWHSFQNIGKFFLENLFWHFQTCENILIGKDCFMSGSEKIEIQVPLLNFFHRQGIFFWGSLIAEWNGPFPIWKDADHMQMPADIASLWNSIKVRLRNCGIFRSKEHDILIWKSSKILYEVQVKDVYKDLISKVPSRLNPSFPAILWKSGCPLKMTLFAWLAFHNRNLIWDNLRKRGWQGPGVCSFCWAEEESNFHLFFACKKTRPLWWNLENAHGIQHFTHSSTADTFFWCSI